LHIHKETNTRKIPNQLWDAIATIAGMKHPSVANLLRKRGFGYEADRMEQLTTAFEEATQKEQEKKHVRERPHCAR
jgi:hypothetical protein